MENGDNDWGMTCRQTTGGEIYRVSMRLSYVDIICRMLQCRAVTPYESGGSVPTVDLRERERREVECFSPCSIVSILASVPNKSVMQFELLR